MSESARFQVGASSAAGVPSDSGAFVWWVRADEPLRFHGGEVGRIMTCSSVADGAKREESSSLLHGGAVGWGSGRK